MRLLVCGPQGSGKTTQAHILSEKYRLCLIKSGDMVREKAKEDSLVGAHMREILEKGILASDKEVAEMVEEALERQDCQNGVVMDGYPRRLSQLDQFDPLLDKVFFLELPREESIKRMLARGRSDDTPEVINERLDVFEKETGPIIKFYENQGILVRIDASKSIEEVTRLIEEALF